MPKIFDRADDKKKKDIVVLADFISIFCSQNHRPQSKVTFIIKDEGLQQILGDKKRLLCRECHRLLSHGIAKLMLCPYDPKPACKKCPSQCYAPGYRERIRKVMRFSGMYLIKHGRLDLIAHYLW